MRRALAFALVAFVLAVAPGAAATKLAAGVQDAGGAPISSATQRLSGSVSQLAVATSTGRSRALHHGFWSASTILVLAVDDGPGGVPAPPARLEFGAPTPNPSNGETRFALSLPVAARVALGVYDVGGREVATLSTREMPAGRWTLEWPGRGVDGALLGPGVYFARVSVNGRVLATRRVVRLR